MAMEIYGDQRYVGQVDIARLETKLENISSNLIEIKSNLEKNYVTQDKFEPVRKLVYGMVGTILMAFLLSVAALLLRK
jgi:hypothetical protein